MTSIFLFSYYLLATNFPVTGHSGTAWQTPRPCQMSSPFGQVAKTVDGWRWMNTYLPWTSWTEFWLLLSFFKGWIICELLTRSVKKALSSLWRRCLILSRLRECDFNDLSGFNFTTWKCLPWIEISGTRWAPSSYKWSYNPCKWPDKWLTVLITLVIGVINPVITGRGPTL